MKEWGEFAADWLSAAARRESPNHDERPAGVAIDLLVIHAISLPPGAFGGPHVDRLFMNALDCASHPYFAVLQGLRVSAHFFIDRHGRLTQYVPLSRRAWHAGASSFAGRGACNDFSLGVELEGTDDAPFTAAQYACLVTLTRALMRRFPGITIRRVVGHADIAPGRKTDPGLHFDWPGFRAAMGERLP